MYYDLNEPFEGFQINQKEDSFSKLRREMELQEQRRRENAERKRLLDLEIMNKTKYRW